ncbi:MAG: hypothetical protein KF902_12585 [Phycisphaeraceae bacterium]|nr:hypothetical protein [Phycisphaeraceae bacterium]
MSTPTAIPSLRCLSCGYDLAGLPESGHCPECGTPIARSLRGNLFRYASPGYVRTLRGGATLALVASLIYIFDWVPKIPLAMIFAALQIGSMSVLDAFFDIATLATMLFGWWMLSTPDPAFVGVDSARDWRVRLRVLLPFASAVILFNAVAGSVFRGVLSGTVTIGSGGAMMSFSYAEMLSWISRFVHAIVIYCGLRYIHVISMRFPSLKLRNASSNAYATLGMIITLLVLVVGCGIGGRFVGWLVAGAVFFAACAGIALIVWLFQYFGLLGRLRSELTRAIITAEAIAQAEHRLAAQVTEAIQPPPITQSGSEAS